MITSFQLVIDEATHHIRSSGMAFGKKPTWISGPDQNGTLVIHVVGSLLYDGEGGSAYAPSRFLVLRVDHDERKVDFLTALNKTRVLMIYECTLLVEIMGIPKKPSKRRML